MSSSVTPCLVTANSGRSQFIYFKDGSSNYITMKRINSSLQDEIASLELSAKKTSQVVPMYFKGLGQFDTQYTSCQIIQDASLRCLGLTSDDQIKRDIHLFYSTLTVRVEEKAALYILNLIQRALDITSPVKSAVERRSISSEEFLRLVKCSLKPLTGTKRVTEYRKQALLRSTLNSLNRAQTFPPPRAPPPSYSESLYRQALVLAGSNIALGVKDSFRSLIYNRDDTVGDEPPPLELLADVC